jgi:AraC-like DNA-binding protein
MKVNTERFRIGSNSDNFLPRHQCIECFHSEACRIFGIKFKISPILLEKKVNFSEYRTSMNPLSYLIDRNVIKEVRKAPDFSTRVHVLSSYFHQLISSHALPSYLSIVTSVLEEFRSGRYTKSVDELAESHKISARTLQRYFEQAMSLGTKQTLQILRMRHAVEFISGGGNFNPVDFGYYDQSHFARHLKKFAEPYDLSEIRLFSNPAD